MHLRTKKKYNKQKRENTSARTHVSICPSYTNAPIYTYISFTLQGSEAKRRMHKMSLRLAP